MKIHFLVISLVLFLSGHSQPEPEISKHKNYPSISVNYQYGDVLPTTDFARGDNISGEPLNQYQSFTIKMLWQNPG